VTGWANDDRQRHIRLRLVSSLRVVDGVAALCPACHRDLPGIDGVVLTAVVAHAGWIILSDSGPNGDQLEDLHATLGEGPRTDAVTTGEPVTAADLVHARARWPRFAQQALAYGLRAVFAFPVRLDTQPVGVLSVYRASAGPLSTTAHHRVNQYAHTATVLLRGTAYVTGAGAVSMPMPGNAGEVQQAVGVVMELATVDAVTALHRLRFYAHQSQRPMRDVVAEVRTGHLSFDPTTPT
jgi:GAF domain-containing protein